MQNQSVNTLKTFAILLLGAWLVSLPLALRAGTATMTASDTSGSSLTTAGNWSPSAIPSSGNDYFSSTFTINTTANATAQTFLGQSLTIQTGGQLQGKYTSGRTLTIPYLILAGGIVRNNVTAVNWGVGNAGSSVLNVSSASSLGALGTGQVVINAMMTNSGALLIPDTLDAANAGTVRLAVANPYSGTITVSNNSYASGVNHLLLLNIVDAVSNATVNLTAPIANPLSFGVAGTFNVGVLTGSSTQALTNTTGTAITLSIGGNNGSGVFSGALTDSGGVTKAGTGALTLNGTNTYSGATTVSAGTLVIGGAGRLGAANYAGNITNNGVLVNNSSAVQSWSGVISGSGSLTNSGGGTLILSGANTYSGNTTISNGVLVVSSAQSGSGNISVADGATLGVTVSGTSQLPPANLTLGTSAGATLILSNATSTSVAPISAGNVSFAGTLTLNLSSGGFTPGNNYPLISWSGTGLSSTNGITPNLPPAVQGNLAIVGTTLYLQVPGLPVPQPLSWTGGNGTWDISNNTNLIWKDGVSSPAYYQEAFQVVFDTTVGAGGTVSLNTTVSPANITVSNGAAAYTISGTGAIAGSTALTKSGAGTLTLATTNTYSGGTTISAGTLQLGDGASANGSVVGNITNNATLVFANVGAQTNTSVISGGGTLTKLAAGTLTLTATNTYTGNTTISAGTLQLGDGTVNNGDLAGNITNNAALIFANPNAQTNAATIVGTGSLTKSGAGVLTLTGSNSYSGGTTNTAGTLNITNDAALGATNGSITFSGSSKLQAGASLTLNTNRAITINSSVTATFDSLANQFTVNGNITGAGTLNKPSGSGTVILAGDNSGWTGSVTIDNNNPNGWLQLASSTALGPTGTAKNIDLHLSTGADTGGIQLINNVTITNKNLSIGGRSSGLYVLQNVSGNNTWAGDISIANSGGNYYLNSAAGRLELSGRLYNSLASSSRKFTLLGAGDYLIDGTVTDGGSGKSSGLIASGTGTVTVSAYNTSTGGTTLSSGQLNVNSISALGGGTFTISGGMLDNTSGGAITLTNNNAQSWNADFTFVGTYDLNLGTGAVALNNATRQVTVNGGTLTVGGGISSTNTGYGITKLGAGALALNGTNTYTGETMISAGKLVVPVGGSASNSAVTVAATGGNSAVLSVVVADTTQPWVGTNLTVNNGGTSSSLDFNFGVLTPGTTTAPLNIAGDVSFTSIQSISVEGVLSATTGNGYPLLTWGGSGPASAAGITLNLTGLPGRSTAALAIIANTLYLQINSTQPLSWTGGNGTWDIDNSANTIWQDSGATPTYYQESGVADQVVFDTTVGSGGTVTLNTNVSPVSVTVNNPSADYTISGSGAIAGSTTVTKLGAGTLTLATTNTYSGGTTISAGTLQLGNGTSANGSVGGNITDNSALVFANPGAQTNTSVISGGGTLTKSAAGTLTVTATNTYIGGTTISAGTLQLGDGSTQNGVVAGNITNNAALIFANPNAQTSAGIISGGGKLTKSAAGKLTLTAINTFTGNTTISAGTLQLGDGTANNGDLPGNITNNAALIFANPNAQTNAATIVGTGAVTKNAAGVLTLVGNNSYSGGTTNAAGTLNITNDAALGATSGGLTFSGSSTLQAGASLSLNTNRLITLNTGVTSTLDPQTNQLIVRGNITGAGTLNRPTGTGTLVLAGDNSNWTGPLTLGATGWVQVASSTALGASGTVKTIALNSAATDTSGIQLINNVTIANKDLTLRGRAAGNYFLQNVSDTNVWAGTIIASATGGSYYISSLAGLLELSGVITNTVNNTSARNVVFQGAGATLVSGVIKDGATAANNPVQVTLSGPGVLTLTGTNTYSGPTTLFGGTLVVGATGVVSTNTVTVATNGTLGGNGLILGAVSVAGGTLAPGTSGAISTLTISNTLTLAANSTNVFRLDATGAGTNDNVAGLTGVTYGGNLSVVTNGNGTLAIGQVYQLFKAAAYSSNFTTVTLPALPPTLAWSNSLAVNGSIQVVAATSGASTNALLTSLVISPSGNLSPSFASGVIAYTTTNSYGSMPTVTVTNADLTATNRLIYNGATNLLASGVASSALTLNANPGVTNVIKVQVTAQDGVTVNTYTVNVQQLPSVSSPPVLTNSIGVNSLTLNWPLANLGYRLQIQTNSLSTGLSGNWVDWPNSTQTNNAVIPVIPGNPSVFLRLVYP